MRPSSSSGLPMKYELLQTACTHFDGARQGMIAMADLANTLESFRLPLPLDLAMKIASRHATGGMVRYREFVRDLHANDIHMGDFGGPRQANEMAFTTDFATGERADLVEPPPTPKPVAHLDEQPHYIYGSDLKSFDRLESEPPHGYHEHAYHHMRPIDKELDPEEPWMQGVYRMPLDLMHGKNRPREHPARSAAAAAMAAVDHTRNPAYVPSAIPRIHELYASEG